MASMEEGTLAERGFSHDGLTCWRASNVTVWQSAVIITLRTKLSGAVYCYRSCLCVCSGWAGAGAYVCGSITTITWNYVHRSSPKWVCR